MGAPVGIAVGAVLAVWLRTSGDDALTLSRGDRVDLAFTRQLDPSPTPRPIGIDGRFLLVIFGYTSCPDVCPTTLLAVHRALESLGVEADRVVPVFVTVDPDRDTRERLVSYTGGFDARIRSLSERAVVASTLREFRARAERQNGSTANSYSMDHTAVVYVIDPDRRVIAALPENNSALDEAILGALRGSPAFGSPANRN